MIELVFTGPFGWFSKPGVPALSGVPEGQQSGVYLWTVSTEAGELVHYVGETGRTFAWRMEEHLLKQLSGAYRIYDPALFRLGMKVPLWEPKPTSTGEELGLLGFIERLPELAAPLAGFVKQMRFWTASTDFERRMRERIEAAISLHLRMQPPPVGPFQDKGGRCRRRRPNEQVIQVRISAGPILGLPEMIDV